MLSHAKLQLLDFNQPRFSMIWFFSQLKLIDGDDDYDDDDNYDDYDDEADDDDDGWGQEWRWMVALKWKLSLIQIL